MKRKSIKELGRFLGCAVPSDAIISGFAIDSRKVQRGEVFFALPGKKVDGHSFIKEAAERKAAAAIVSKQYQGEHFGLDLIAVDDVRGALQTLARDIFSKRKDKVIGVTGSVGKTTTKEFIAHLLSAKFRVFKTAGSFNSQLTFPLTLLNLEGEYDYLVLEMGMSTKGEIQKLTEIASPDIAVITQIAYAHAEFFPGGIEEIAGAKAEIFSQPKTKLLITSTQAIKFQEIAKALCRKVTYSIEDEADYRLQNGDQIYEKARSVKVSLPFAATHLQENFLAAYAVCRECGIEPSEILARANTLKNAPLRFEVVEKEGIVFVKDCYNANPTSMRAALLNLPSPVSNGKRIAVLGSMKELGRFSESFHKEIGELALQHVDQLYCLGQECQIMLDLFSKAGKRAEIFSNLLDLKKNVENSVKKGDVVLVKGSHSHQLWKLFED